MNLIKQHRWVRIPTNILLLFALAICISCSRSKQSAENDEAASQAGFATPEEAFHAYAEAGVTMDIEKAFPCLTKESMHRLAGELVLIEIRRATETGKWADTEQQPKLKEIFERHGIDVETFEDQLPEKNGTLNRILEREEKAGSLLNDPIALISELAELKYGGESRPPESQWKHQILDVEIDGNDAKGIHIQTREGKVRDDPVFFKKVDGRWFVHFPKETSSQPETVEVPSETTGIKNVVVIADAAYANAVRGMVLEALREDVNITVAALPWGKDRLKRFEELCYHIRSSRPDGVIFAFDEFEGAEQSVKQVAENIKVVTFGLDQFKGIRHAHVGISDEEMGTACGSELKRSTVEGKVLVLNSRFGDPGKRAEAFVAAAQREYGDVKNLTKAYEFIHPPEGFIDTSDVLKTNSLIQEYLDRNPDIMAVVGLHPVLARSLNGLMHEREYASRLKSVVALCHDDEPQLLKTVSASNNFHLVAINDFGYGKFAMESLTELVEEALGRRSESYVKHPLQFVSSTNVKSVTSNWQDIAEIPNPFGPGGVNRIREYHRAKTQADKDNRDSRTDSHSSIADEKEAGVGHSSSSSIPLIVAYDLGFHWGMVADAVLFRSDMILKEFRPRAETSAKKLGIQLPPTVQADNKVGRILGVLDQHTAIGKLVREKAGQEGEALFKIASYLQIARGLYEPKDKGDENPFMDSTIDELRKLMKTAKLPESLIAPVVSDVNSNVIKDRMAKTIFEVNKTIADRVRKRGMDATGHTKDSGGPGVPGSVDKGSRIDGPDIDDKKD